MLKNNRLASESDLRTEGSVQTQGLQSSFCTKFRDSMSTGSGLSFIPPRVPEKKGLDRRTDGRTDGQQSDPIRVPFFPFEEEIHDQTHTAQVITKRLRSLKRSVLPHANALSPLPADIVRRRRRRRFTSKTRPVWAYEARSRRHRQLIQLPKQFPEFACRFHLSAHYRAVGDGVPDRKGPFSLSRARSGLAAIYPVDHSSGRTRRTGVDKEKCSFRVVSSLEKCGRARNSFTAHVFRDGRILMSRYCNFNN
ncbi:hypothetical protein EVAR_84505_1 [Eumeta japonica]|uniref:Uncharacterized protein n=1 Tax=Eumeta variegata TaxID=151549 RepID=A0A4C1UIM5_EUMVA|nr:hypothetical protein EVAR_84505_1 [Eumeta japonica]